MKKAILITVADNGLHTVSQVEFSAAHTLEDLYGLIDCETIDIVHCYGLSGIAADMIVDDEGLFKDNPLINVPASILYGCEQHGQPIVGNALIVKPVETPDGIESDGFSPSEIEHILSRITRR